MTVQGSGSGGTAAQYAAGTEPVQTGVAGGDGEGERGHKAVVRGKQLWRSREKAAAPRRHLKGSSEEQHPS